jgi:MFS family permease
VLRFLHANTRWLLAGFLLTMFSSFGQTFFIGLSGNELRASFSLSDGEFGTIYMLATLGSALTLPWLGKFLDVLPGRKMALFVMPALAAACLLLAYAPHVAVLALAIYLLRLLGQGMMTHIALTEVSRWFVANRGRAISLIGPGHQAGEAFFPVVFVLVSAAFGWQFAWTAGAGITLLVALPVIYLLMQVERVPTHSDALHAEANNTRDWTRAEVVRDPMFYLLLIGVLVPSFIGTTIFFHQGHLVEVRGYDPLAFATAFPIMAATTVVLGLVCGALIDRLGAVRLLPFFLLPMVIASLAAAWMTSVWGVYLFMFLFGISYGFTSPLLGALWPEVYGTRHLGAIRSIVMAAMVFSTAVGPGLTGALIDRGVTLPEQLVWMAAWCGLATAGLAIAVRRITRRQTQRC